MIDRPFRLFEAFGVELEYMIVDRGSLAVLPVADKALGISGGEDTEVDHGDLAWSNELVLHVLEFKSNGPAPSLGGLAERFQRGVVEANAELERLGARLMPSAMHPWMDPRRETVLWPHGNREIYESFDRIFSCQGHGWSNLQSAHLNLPFHGDDEFGRLHAAIRLVMPIMPALAAASPLVEGRPTGKLDNRLDVYRTNCRRIPSVTGRVIPEPVSSRAEYFERILQPMYRDVAPYDPDGILQYEWLNARGAIARFERDTIEVRVLDVQECPKADLAILRATVAALRACVEERWLSLRDQQAWAVEPLEAIFLETVARGEAAVIEDPAYRAAFGLGADGACTAGRLWLHIVETLVPEELASPGAPLNVILRQGTLARRILNAVGPDPSPPRIADVYRCLCTCLAEGRMFTS